MAGKMGRGTIGCLVRSAARPRVSMGQSVRITHTGTRLSRRSAALLWLAVACVALMPSIYRGGAEVPHAHSFFQFWFSGPEAAFDHHHEHGAGMVEEHQHPLVE